MRALRQQLKQPRDPGETFDQFLERMGDQLHAVFERYTALFTGWGSEVRMGRPPRLPRQRPKPKMGRPVKYTSELTQAWVTRIALIFDMHNWWKLPAASDPEAAKRRRRLTLADALALDMRDLIATRLRDAGHPPLEAERLAEQEAREREASPDWPNQIARLKDLFSRTRSRRRPTRRR
jgi:hypothetical protein